MCQFDFNSQNMLNIDSNGHQKTTKKHKKNVLKQQKIRARKHVLYISILVHLFYFS